MKTEMREMTDNELRLTEGGNWAIFLAGAIVAAGAYLAKGVVENWEEFKEGVVEGYNTFA